MSAQSNTNRKRLTMATKTFDKIFTPNTRNGSGDSVARCTAPACKTYGLPRESRRGTGAEAHEWAEQHDAENHSN
jgi:hypothetical protein